MRFEACVGLLVGSKVVKHGKMLLKLGDTIISRNTRNEIETAKWRTYLRHSGYLSLSAPFVQNMNGDWLNDSLIEFYKQFKSEAIVLH